MNRDPLRRALPYHYRIPVAVLLGLAPFRPQPHLIEKLPVLAAGARRRPIDIVDLVRHGGPLVLLVVRAGLDLLGGRPGRPAD